MARHPEPLFIDVDSGPLGQRFALYHAPHQGPARGLVVYVHPFAEEMNKSRRMAALQSRALAKAGFAVLQMDLLGCGDSAGDSSDATWACWVADVVFACSWLKQRQGDPPSSQPAPPLWLWGLRAGCLLAVEAAAQLREPCHFLFWQPPASGKPLLQQFLRLASAGDLLGAGAKGVTSELRGRIAAGQPVEVAGYALQADLCLGLEGTALRPPALPDHGAGRVEWIEVSPREDAELSPASITCAAQWTQAGWATRTHLSRGPAFWQTTEIEDAPELITSTLAALAAPPARQAVTTGTEVPLSA